MKPARRNAAVKPVRRRPPAKVVVVLAVLIGSFAGILAWGAAARPAPADFDLAAAGWACFAFLCYLLLSPRRKP